MVFIRGHALDFEGWRQSGCAGWSYADVLPYFKRMESYSHGGDAFRGAEGPLNVYRPSPKDPLALAFIKSGEQAGYPLTDDICGHRQEGFGVWIAASTRVSGGAPRVPILTRRESAQI